LYKPNNGAFVYYLRDSETLKSCLPVTSLCFCPRGTASADLLLATYASGKVKVWHVSTQRCLQTLLENQETLIAAFNPSGTRFATGGTTGSIRLYDTLTRECLLTLTSSPSPTVMDGHRSRIFALKFHPGSFSDLVSGGWDDTVQFWTENQPHSVRRIFGPHLCGDALQIHPETNEILTGSWRRENSLEVWDYDSGQKIQDIPEDDSGHCLIYSCHWLGSDHLIGAGTRNNACRLFDRGSMTTVGGLGKLPQGVYSTDVTPDGVGRSIVAACCADRVYILEHQLVTS
ncbi:pre-mRNA-processing factor 17-like, partial [Mustelus asterias]